MKAPEQPGSQKPETEGGLAGGDRAVNGDGFSFARRKSPAALLHNNVNILNTTVHSKMIKMVNFTLGFFYSNKKKSYHNND